MHAATTPKRTSQVRQYQFGTLSPEEWILVAEWGFCGGAGRAGLRVGSGVTFWYLRIVRTKDNEPVLIRYSAMRSGSGVFGNRLT